MAPTIYQFYFPWFVFVPLLLQCFIFFFFNLSIVSLFFFCNSKETEDSKAVGDGFVRDQIANFIIAGRDTTAILLAWTFYFLSANPHVLDKVFFIFLS